MNSNEGGEEELYLKVAREMNEDNLRRRLAWGLYMSVSFFLSSSSSVFWTPGRFERKRRLLSFFPLEH